MSRGSNTLFADIFENAKPVEKQRKGRSSTLIAQRNECLIDRYYYYGKFHNSRYSFILKTLSTEFFISEVTIPEVIDDNFNLLSQLKTLQPNTKYFKDKWPFLQWP